ncbi:MAG: structural constituent of ribosome, partial [Paramarteilia canceri]
MVVYDRKTDSKRRPSEDDLSMLLKSGALIGSKRVSAHMRPFMFKAERDYSLHSATNAAPDTVDSAFDLKTTWNQLNLAALMVAGILKPETQLLFVASNERSKIAATRAANLLNAQVMTGRYVPGTLTNPLQ